MLKENFYHYYTEEPIKSPFEVTNENKSFISKILREEVVHDPKACCIALHTLSYLP